MLHILIKSLQSTLVHSRRVLLESIVTVVQFIKISSFFISKQLPNLISSVVYGIVVALHC